ncbi:MAG: type III-B CRISPR module RAMP protein Cmr4 [Deltaproteobacteria bacterium]|nr:MAG: type III-B CRISPR module RAMP protein Cmr4 [Deltaproteobacteria bacterium]
MYPEKEIIIFHIESALHAGAGASIGHIDNPVQRETATGNPVVQASGVKGALREFYEKTVSGDDDMKKIDAVFGKEKGERDEKDGAGAVAFGEAKLLFFPVRSLAGIFAYITCPSIIARFQRDLRAADKDMLMVSDGKRVDKIWRPSVSINRYLSHTNSIVKISPNGLLILEELSFEQQNTDNGDQCLEFLSDALFPDTPEYIPFKSDFPKRVAILNDTDYFYFVKYSTEVEPHNRIKDTGTVDENTGVWYTEYLPAESILYSSLFIGQPRIQKDIFNDDAANVKIFIEKVDGKRTWLGGDRTTGKGRVMMRLYKTNKANTKNQQEK